MWPNQRSSWAQPDLYQAQQQMQRGQQLQQMAMQQPGTGWAGLAMALLGGFGGRRMEERGYDLVVELQAAQQAQEQAKRDLIAKALTGGDIQAAAREMYGLPGMEAEATKLLVEANKPKQVPEAILSRYTPESVQAFTRNGDYSVLQPIESTDMKGLPTGYRWNPETGQAERIAGLGDYFDRMGKKATAGTAPTIINLPGGGQAIAPTKATQNAAQGDLIAAQRSLQALDVIGQSYADNYLTMGGRAQAYGLGLADKAGIPIGSESKQFLAGKRQFQQQVEQAFNQYRISVTGAAASEKELESLRQTFLNSDLGPTEFMASFDALKGQMQRDIGYYQNLLSSGIPVHEARDLFRATPFGADPAPQAAPSSDASKAQAQLQGELDRAVSTAPNAPTNTGMPRVTNDAEYDALPSGARFIDPDGNQRVKP